MEMTKLAIELLGRSYSEYVQPGWQHLVLAYLYAALPIWSIQAMCIPQFRRKIKRTIKSIEI